MRWCARGVLLAALAAGVPASGVAQDAEPPLDGRQAAGLCSRCHEEQTIPAVETDGHSPALACKDCHPDRRPRRFGRRHRAVLSCTKHHDEVGHPQRASKQSGGSKQHRIRDCIACHGAHGSHNASLVAEEIRTGRRALSPVVFDGPVGAAPGGFTNPAAPGSGVCETCHRKTAFYRRDGTGEAHFTDTCTLCHEHAIGFGVVISEENCTACHAEEGARFAKPSLHSAELLCSECHEEATPRAEPGHRSVPNCADCHSNSATHAPPGHEPLACTRCHDPHGTDNITLVLDEIETPGGSVRPVRFDSFQGVRDGGFASASAPGSGICEVCHATTQFYRGDGTGAQHFEFSCLPCHRHAGGFSPVK
jgi:predicted CXXCH cytochrome family protein